MNKRKTIHDRLAEECKPDGKGRYKTVDVIKMAKQLEEELYQANKKIFYLEEEIKAYKGLLRSATSNK